MVDLLIGCPVRRREWILRPWFLFADQAAEVANLKPAYVVALASTDVESREVVEKCCADGGRQLFVVETGEKSCELLTRPWDVMPGPPPPLATWNEIRYREMVDIRNQLLDQVREIGPELFLSLDSDILIHERVIANMVENLGRFDAVGGKCYMTPYNTAYPSYGMFLNANGLLRPDSDWVMPVDCIMAIKLMTPKAYAIDYRLHYQGEDAGWSSAATAAGLKLGWDGRITSKHVMTSAYLDAVDPRCGY